MGFSDIIPGVSGGTIALITGIYPRLIKAINNFFSLIILFIDFLKGLISFSSFKRSFKNQDWSFLGFLLAGILLAIISGSWLILFLLNNFLAYTLSFFIGLILFSAIIIFRKVLVHSLTSSFLGFLGLLFGLSLAFAIPVSFPHSWFFLLLAGFLAVSALFLPGISGSFILLIIGLYSFMIEALHSLIVSRILPFLIGAILGVFFISRLVAFLLRRFENSTLTFLTGLVLGALAIPLKKLIPVLTPNNTLWSILFFILGLGLVFLISQLSVDSQDSL